MTDTCFANSPNLLAELHSLGKTAHGILYYLARHKHVGEKQQQITPNFSHPTKKRFFTSTIPAQSLFGMGCSTLEKSGSSKRRGNEGIKWHKEHRTWFFIKLSLHPVVKPCQTPVLRGCHGGQETFPHPRAHFSPLCVSVTRCPI